MDNISITISAMNLISKAEECERLSKELAFKAKAYREEANRLISNECFKDIK